MENSMKWWIPSSVSDKTFQKLLAVEILIHQKLPHREVYLDKLATKLQDLLDKEAVQYLLPLEIQQIPLEDQGYAIAMSNEMAMFATQINWSQEKQSIRRLHRNKDSAEPNNNGMGDKSPIPLDELQTPYKSSSKGFNEEIFVPTGLASAMDKALVKLKSKVGDLDDFVKNELQYKDTKSLHKAFMGLQVDGIALTLDNLKSGKGMIIADQTGVGKGRQAAAIIRWSLLNGKTPIFMTEKPNLFSDIYSDLLDIDSKGVKPFIMNSETAINKKNKDNSISEIFGNKPAVTKAIIDNGKLPSKFNAIFSTYSQINRSGNSKQAFLNSLGSDTVYILDEAHNAGGDSNTFTFLNQALKDSENGTLYLSATFAKRPNNMPIYFKTDISEATDDNASLVAAI